MTTAPAETEIELDTAVTTIIRQQPRPGAVGRYEEWLKAVIPVARSFAGHQGVSVIRPRTAAEAYTIVLHFDTVAHLRKWLDSDLRAQLIEKIQPDLQTPEMIDVTTGLEFWFTPPAAGKAARPYKQFLVTLSAIFPLTILVPWVLRPLFEWLPPLAGPGVRQLVVAVAIVGLMVYVIMPRYTRAIARWLFR